MTFSAYGRPTLTGTLNEAGKAAVSISDWTIGIHTVTVSYSGDSNNTSAAATFIQTVLPAAPAGLTAAAGDGQATLSWGTVTGATYYSIYRQLKRLV